MAKGFWNDTLDYRSGHEVTFWRSGPGFFAELVKIIETAQESIHLQVYIVEPDDTGRPVLDALQAAARKGIQVYLVVDDYGSDRLEEIHERALADAGVNFKRFEPYFSSKNYYIGRRMHHKLMVVDEKIAFVGGMNIADRYRGTPNTPPWLDYAVVVKGPVCEELARACRRIFDRQFLPAAPRWPRMPLRTGMLPVSETWVRVRKNDWLRNRGEITLSYNRAARMATESITIVGGYFLPGMRFRRILANASKRGVAIRIIMTGYSDVPVVKYASDYLYGWLLRNHIRIYEMKGNTMVHGKVAIVDETWATVGSYNQNHLSAYFSIELNLDIVNGAFAAGFNRHLLEIIDKECVEITADTYYRHASWLSKLRRWVSYQLVRLSLRILFLMNRIFVVND